jgi:hypothetical protein
MAAAKSWALPCNPVMLLPSDLRMLKARLRAAQQLTVRSCCLQDPPQDRGLILRLKACKVKVMQRVSLGNV